MNLSTYETILHSITGLTIICQLYIFYLVNWKSSKNMRHYKFYLNFFSLWDLSFTVIFGCLIQPDPTGRLMSGTVRGLLAGMDPKVQMFAACVCIYCACNMLLSQDFCLLYRFAAIREDRHLHEALTGSRAKLVLIIFAQFLSLMASFFTYQMFVKPEKLSVLPEFLAYFQSDQFVLWVDLNSPTTRICVVTALIALIISEFFCVYMIYAILSSLRKNAATFSRNTYKLHWQLTLLLAVQLATPLLMVIFPVSVRLVNVFSIGGASPKIEPGVSRFGFIFFTFYGFSNSFLTILFVAPFRIYTYNELIYPWLQPFFSFMGIASLAPRRKSLLWNSSTNYNPNRRPTIVKTTMFSR